MRYGYHLVTDCLKANQGKKSHKDVEATIIHHFNTYTSITATKAKPFTDDTQAYIAAPRSTSQWPGTGFSTMSRLPSLWGSPTRSSSIVLPLATSRARESTITSAKQAEDQKHAKYDAICAATGSIFSPFALETTGGHGACTAAVLFLFTKQLRFSGLPADVLVWKVKNDISFALAGASDYKSP